MAELSNTIINGIFKANGKTYLPATTATADSVPKFLVIGSNGLVSWTTNAPIGPQGISGYSGASGASGAPGSGGGSSLASVLISMEGNGSNSLSLNAGYHILLFNVEHWHDPGSRNPFKLYNDYIEIKPGTYEVHAQILLDPSPEINLSMWFNGIEVATKYSNNGRQIDLSQIITNETPYNQNLQIALGCDDSVAIYHTFDTAAYYMNHPGGLPVIATYMWIHEINSTGSVTRYDWNDIYNNNYK